jgi:succinate dehydrogenase/fumarate reductase flavoprotein subunit
VRPAITFTQGGLRIDTSARVLDESGKPIDGLFAAGADAGGMYNGGYAGGLSMSAVLGLRAAEAIAGDRAVS